MNINNFDCHLSLCEAARYLGKSPRWLQYQLAGPHPPPGFKPGKCWVFRKSELNHWLEQFRASAPLDQLVDEVMKELRT
ncbi:MAG: helix-turn-helix domain-containing protein [Candidatus Binatia bacterium]